MEKGVKYIKTILKEMSDEKDIDYKELLEIWRLHKKYVKELMDQEDTFSIHLPNLGNLHYNAFYSRLLAKRGKKSKRKEDNPDLKGETVRELIEEDKKREKQVRYPQIERPIFYKILKQIYLKIAGRHKRYRPKRDSINIIQKFYNDTITEEDLKV